MPISTNFIKGVANILREDTPSADIFVASLKDKRKELDKEEFENLYRNIVVALRENNHQLLENLIDEKVIEFFAQRILARIENSNNTTGELGEITLEDVEIACFKSNLDGIQAVYQKILVGISKFISSSILQTNIKIEQEGIRAFLTNNSLPWLILRITLALHRQNNLQKANAELKALYEYRLFQYYVFLKTLPREYQEEFSIALTNGTVVATILWVLEKENLDLSKADSPFRFRGSNNISPTYQIGTLLEEIFSKAQEYNKAVLNCLEIIENCSLLYTFLAKLEKISTPASQNMKLLIAEQILQNLFLNEKILEKNKDILVDFTKFFTEYRKEEFKSILRKLNQMEPKWFKPIIKKNLDSDNEILWQETAMFLILEPICSEWDRDIRNILKKFLQSKLSDDKFLVNLMKNEKHYLLALLERFIKKTQIKLNLLFTQFGRNFSEYLKEYLRGKNSKERLVQLFLQNLHRFLRQKDIKTFSKNILEFVSDNIDLIDIERFKKILELGGNFFKTEISQDDLARIGQKIIARGFPKIPASIFLDLVKLKGSFKDEINLKENVKKYIKSVSAGSDKVDLLKKLLKYVK